MKLAVQEVAARLEAKGFQFLQTLSLSCLSASQGASRGRGVPPRAEEGSVPAGQSPRPEGGRPSAGLWLESAKERQSTMPSLQ